MKDPVSFVSVENLSSHRLDFSTEPVPASAVFGFFQGERFSYEPRRKWVSKEVIQRAIKEGQLTDFDIRVLCLIGAFTPAFVNFRSLKELLLMAGGEDGEIKVQKLSASLCKLEQYNLTVVGKLESESDPDQRDRVIHLTVKGSQLVKSYGVMHRFNPNETIDAPTAKARAQTSMTIVNFLKHLSDRVTDFKVRPILVNKTVLDEGIVRPAGAITVDGEEFFFEVPRRGRFNWKEDLAEKLYRYTVVFEGEVPCVVLNCEDKQMSRELLDHLNGTADIHGFPMENVLFTDDLSLFGKGFSTCLYTFDGRGERIPLEIFDPEKKTYDDPSPKDAGKTPIAA